LLPDTLRVGPVWLPLVLAASTVIGARFTHWRGWMIARRGIALGALTMISLAVTVSAAYLIGALISRNTEAGTLLRDAALLWLSNLLTFALLYWELDGG